MKPPRPPQADHWKKLSARLSAESMEPAPTDLPETADSDDSDDSDDSASSDSEEDRLSASKHQKQNVQQKHKQTEQRKLKRRWKDDPDPERFHPVFSPGVPWHSLDLVTFFHNSKKTRH